jgi:uncharacterized protein with HEPN domain
MSSPRDTTAILDIEQAARKILKYQQGLDKAAFIEDDKTQSAIVFQLLILGEAVKRLSQDFRTQHPNIPWALIAGMRDNLSMNTMILIGMKFGTLQPQIFRGY